MSELNESFPWSHSKAALISVINSLRCLSCNSLEKICISTCCNVHLCSKCFCKTKTCPRCNLAVKLVKSSDIGRAVELCKKLSAVLNLKLPEEGVTGAQGFANASNAFKTNSRESSEFRVPISLKNSLEPGCQELNVNKEQDRSDQQKSLEEEEVEGGQPSSFPSNQLSFSGFIYNAGDKKSQHLLEKAKKIRTRRNSKKVETPVADPPPPVSTRKRKKQATEAPRVFRSASSLLQTDSDLDLDDSNDSNSKNLLKKLKKSEVRSSSNLPNCSIPVRSNTGAEKMTFDEERELLAASSLLLLSSPEEAFDHSADHASKNTLPSPRTDGVCESDLLTSDAFNRPFVTPVRIQSRDSSAFMTPASEVKSVQTRSSRKSLSASLQMSAGEEPLGGASKSAGGKSKRKESIERNVEDTPGVGPKSGNEKNCSVKELDESSEGSKRQARPRAASAKNSAREKKPYKTNAKGETDLHLACKKGNLDVVKKLLTEGVDPNVRDNAGWTPLHEACVHGRSEAVKLLLDHGALIDPCGYENFTPLHEAVQSGHATCVQMLLSKGADVNKRSANGLTPLQLATVPDIEDMLREHANVVTSASDSLKKIQKTVQAAPPSKVIVMTTGLEKDKKEFVLSAIEKLGWGFENDINENVSHVITSANENKLCQRTAKYMTAILLGKWIVTFEWLKLCEEKNRWMSEESFEIQGCNIHPTGNIPSKARSNALLQLPGLFDGCTFYLNPSLSNQLKTDLISFIKLGSGHLLQREPKIGDVDLEMADLNTSLNVSLMGRSLSDALTSSGLTASVPHHVRADSAFADCSYFVVTKVVKNGQANYELVNRKLCKVTPTWFFDCISSFSIVE